MIGLVRSRIALEAPVFLTHSQTEERCLLVRSSRQERAILDARGPGEGFS